MQRVSLKKEHSRFALLAVACLLIAVLMIVRDVGGVAIPRIVFIGIGAAVCAFGAKADIYGLLAFIAPLANGISYTYICAIALLFLVLRKNRFSMNRLGLISISGILLIELFSAVRGGFSFINFLRFIGVFLVTFGSMNEICDETDSTLVLRLFVVGYLVAMTDMIMQMLTIYSFSELLTLGIRIGNTRNMLDVEEGFFLSFNQNGLGMLCLLAASVSVVLAQGKRGILYYPVVLFSVLIGITTQSRAFFLTLILGLLIILFSSSAPLKTKLLIIVGGILAAVLANKFLPEYLAAFRERLGDCDLSGGRIDIFKAYFNEMFADPIRPLFGVGMQGYQRKSDYYASAHNATQEVLVTWGFFGLVLVIVMYISILKNAKRRNPSARIIQYVPFILLLFFKQSGQGFTDWASMLWFFVAFCAITYHADRKGQGETDEADSIYTHV